MKKFLAVLASLLIILMGGVAPASADTTSTTTTTTVGTTSSSPETTAENAEELRVEQEHGRLAIEQVYFKNCDEVWAKLGRSLKKGEPGYRAGLDRDNDGTACEKDESSTTTTTTTTVTTTSKAEVYYANCTEVWIKLGRSLKKGEPGYRTGLDTDKLGPDGIACEQDPRTTSRAVVPVNNTTALANTGVSQTNSLLALGGGLLVVGAALLLGLNLRRRALKRR